MLSVVAGGLLWTEKLAELFGWSFEQVAWTEIGIAIVLMIGIGISMVVKNKKKAE